MRIRRFHSYMALVTPKIRSRSTKSYHLFSSQCCIGASFVKIRPLVKESEDKALHGVI